MKQSPVVDGVQALAGQGLPFPADVQSRARLSAGLSADPVYAMVAQALTPCPFPGGTLLDLGCGTGRLRTVLTPMFARYVGCDVVRYEGYPEEGEFLQVNFDNERVPLPDGFADVVIAVETIEHLENPRAFLRELTRLTASGGLVLVTTPNNLSLLSKLTLLVKNQFNAFQDSSYPAHLTALLEIDLRRMARECRLVDIRINYSQSGRIPGTARHFPRLLSAWWPRLLSDNVLLIAKKPERPALSSCDQGGNRGPST